MGTLKQSVFAVSLSLLSPLVLAQSSVTLYGIVEDGITYVNNSGGKGGVVALTSSIAQGNRWGLQGAEDLGGGWKTIFKLENGFNPNNGKLGNGGLLFGRTAYVGLTSDRFGTLTVGRQYDAVPDFYALTTMNGNWGAYFSHVNDIDNSDSTYRINNSLKYATPTLGGLQFEALYALGGVPGSIAANSTVSAGLRYSSGPLYVAAVYTSSKQPATQFPDGNWVANEAHPSINGAFGYVGHPASMQVAGVGGTYQIGAARLGISYDNVRFASANGTNSSSIFNNYEVWGQYYITPSVALAGGYTFTTVAAANDSDGGHPKYHQFNIIADWFLSKRTDLQLLAVLQTTSGGAFADIYNGYPATQSSTNRQILTRLGIRHKF
ncbi:porin [Paraburkholderia sp. CNPSo 3281]|uniref:porin n=1 Tax=Paraburkholderia sp. CNPSo 3281 TaxID=2940933 RepID=UPI0020B847A1|nr:porin [Paraburkholderia sp. CNPSo 3281]MCP3720997.1 porin [Paraburkholderia sp. CNPSo 3281]